MTWVVGASTLFGYGVVISDVRVTCTATARTADVLQKAYPVGRYIVAGFAGDVHAGLALLDNLKSFLNSPAPDMDECWDPQWVADSWASEARTMFARLCEEGPTGKTHILMLGLQPQRDVLGSAIGCISVLRSPNFSPETMLGGRKAMSIGCGSEVELYTSALEDIMTDTHLTYMKAEIGNIGGYGRVIAGVLRRIANENPTKGISRDFQVFMVRIGRAEMWAPKDTPRLARSWSELQEMLSSDMTSEALVAGADLVVNRDRYLHIAARERNEDSRP